MVELGDKVKDSISGFEGIATCIATYLAGCRRISVSGTKLVNGVPSESQTFDEPQLIVIKRHTPAKLIPFDKKIYYTGGNQKIPHRTKLS